jgi:ABC-type polysaccharide/polyol phosphate export permease
MKNWYKFKKTFGLSFQLAKAEFKLRNEDSYLGILWYLLNPLLMFGLLFLIFFDRLGHNIPHYALYLLIGIIMFNFFQKTTIEATKTIWDNRFVIKSINFPRESLIAAIVLKFLFSHLFELILLILLLVILNFSLIGLVSYLGILIFFFLFIFGTGLILSALTVYFNDLKNIWFFASTLIWFGTPIFYAIEGQGRLFYLNLFNPMYYFITIARDLIISNEIPELWLISGAASYSLLFIIIGLVIFNMLKIKFAEMI